MTSSRPRAVLLALSIVATLVVLEGAAHLAIMATRGLLDDPITRRSSIYREQSRRMDELLDNWSRALVRVDFDLGWRYRAGYAAGRDTTNTLAVRSAREYPLVPAEPSRRIAAFGDSFVYGNEVSNADAWSSQMEALFPGAEVLNYGVGGYGLDQALLRYRAEGNALAPSTVLIGFVADDLRRLVNVYRRFLSTSESPLFKPRFDLDSGGRLELVRTPIPDSVAYASMSREPRLVREFGAADKWYQSAVYENPLYDWSATVRLVTAIWYRIWNRFLDPDRLVKGGAFNESSRAFQLQIATFREFAREIESRGARPLIVFFPDRTTLGQARAGTRPTYETLRAAASAAGLPSIDLMSDFVREAENGDTTSLFMPGGHYSRRGNAVVARALGRALALSGIPAAR